MALVSHEMGFTNHDGIVRPFPYSIAEQRIRKQTKRPEELTKSERLRK